jgi:hypothetical protein
MTSARRKPLKTTRTEAEVMAQILEAAQMLGLDLTRQNTGAAEYHNADGSSRQVRYGQRGNSDLVGTLPGGRTLQVEVKAEGFDPSKLTGEKKVHFDRQLERLQETNRLGGVGVWVDDSLEFIDIMKHVLAGARIREPGYGRPEIIYPEGPGDA